MAIGPREVMRSEVEGGLSGPANPIPSESLDCGCKQFSCPKLAKFATRRLFVGLLCFIGIVQAAAHAYLHITSLTIARRFQFDPILMEWILIAAELTPFFLGLLVAYWGDRIHRAAWIGSLILLQSASFLILIIPHFTHSTRIIEKPDNVTHMSIYAEDNPELCSSGLTRLYVLEDQMCYTTLVLLIIVQILTGMANVAYYALGISYLDDNTRKRQVGSLIGVAIAVKILGLVLGYFLAWGCLKLDSENLQIVVSHQEQIGAWWLGWPVLAFFLAVPAIFVSWLPRRLPSEVVEQAAASILDLAGRTSPTSIDPTETIKVGGIAYFTSLLRLFVNKILIFNVLAAVFCCTALINFVTNENIFLESRYHVPKPTEMFMDFGVPLRPRLISDILKPIIIGIVIIISGMVIARVRPRATSLTIYNVVVYVVAATIVFSLVYATCEKPPIAGERRGSIALLKYCNKNCRCSKDADFRRTCEARSTFTFYSPCHAGCKMIEIIDNVKIYDECNCVKNTMGLGNSKAGESPCDSSTCQIGWLVFEIATLVAYALVASSIVGSLLIVLRSVYIQDKALAIGFWMTLVSLFVYVPGKLAYKKIADSSCKYWGKSSICHLYDDDKLGNYMCYLTAFLLILAATFEIVLWYFCRKLRLYGDAMSELPREQELQEIERNQVVPLLNETSAGPSNVSANENVNNVDQVVVIESSELDFRERTVDKDSYQRSGQLKYGPVGPGDRRTDKTITNYEDHRVSKDKMRNDDTDDDLDSSSNDEGGREINKSKRNSSSHVAYRPLELDSDVESDLSSIGPRSRRRVPSGIFDDLLKDHHGNVTSSIDKRPFPNPDHYENHLRQSTLLGTTNPRNDKSFDNLESTNTQGGFSRTNSFEFAKRQSTKNDTSKSHDGDFNEVGIPVMEPLVTASVMSPLPHSGQDTAHQELRILLPRHQKQASQERLETIRSLLESVDENRRHHMENDTLREEENEEYPDVPPPIISKPPSRDQLSPGFQILPIVGEKTETVMTSPDRVVKVAKISPPISRKNSPKNSSNEGGPLSTAL